MPQVFGAGQLHLMSMASLWVEADFVDDVNAHEEALGKAGFSHESLPVYLNREGFDGRGQVWGNHLKSDGTHHTWAIARVQNPAVDPNARETSVGGAKPRYSVEIHRVPKDQTGRVKPGVMPVWEGNNIENFLTGTRRYNGDMTWPDVQRAIEKGPRG